MKPQTGSPPAEKEPSPISKERLEFVKARMAVLTDMIVELSTKWARYQFNAHVSRLHSPALDQIRTEHLLLAIEKAVLEEVLSSVTNPIEKE